MKMGLLNYPKFSNHRFYKRIKTYNHRKFKKKSFRVQFHPEVTHTDNGKKIFYNFLFRS